MAMVRAKGLFSCLLLLLAATGCSMKRMALDEMAVVLEDAGRAYETENDLELAAAGFPGSLKLIEGMLESSPEQPVLLRLLADGYTSFAFGFVEDEAEKQQEDNPDRAEVLRQRALRLYLRSRDFGLRMLTLEHPELAVRLREGKMPEEADLADLEVEDVPALFWTASPWGAAIKVGIADPNLLVQLPIVKRLLERCVELDESFYWGGPQMTLGVLEASIPKALGGRPDVASKHFLRALASSHGNHLMTKVMYARGVGVQTGDKDLFSKLLREVVEADPDAEPRLGLSNRLAQRRAERYLAQVDDLFL